MLWTVFVIVMLLWLLGFSFHIAGGLIHVLLVLALIVFIFSLLTGRTTAQKSTVSASKSYNLQRDFIFEPKIFAELKNAESIVLAYDGVNPLPPTFCYLKPYYLDRNVNYFEQLKRGLI